MYNKVMNRNSIERLQLSPRAIERTQQGIKLPDLYADGGLRSAFDGNEFDVTFNSGLLVDGANAIGLSNHISVIMVAEQPKNTERPIQFPANDSSFSRDTVFVAIEDSPEDVKKAQGSANTRLWTAILASNVLDEPVSAVNELERLRKGIRNKALRRKVGGGMLTGAGIAAKVATMTGKVLIPTTSIIASQTVGLGISMLGRRKDKELQNLHLFTDGFEESVIRKMVGLALVLAEEYPIIDYSLEEPAEGLE